MKSAIERRSFLKTSVAGATGLASLSAVGKAFAVNGGAWTDGMQINPAVDNLRVVCCEDPSMVSSTPTSWDVADQNRNVDAAKVGANLDAMAKTLTQMPTPAEAWPILLRKPSTKQWSEVRVLFKANCLNTYNSPRAAIIGKVARVLNGFGVPYGNMQFPELEGNNYAPVIGTIIPAGVVSPWADRKTVTIGAPYNGTRGCWIPMADQVFDIIVNFPVVKNHYPGLGGCTVSMKNHYGTFEANHDGNALDYLLAITKSDIMIGGTPPHQQLIVVDAIFCNANGISSVPDNQLNKLYMGTFGPVIDYLVAKALLVDEMHNWDASGTDAANSRKRFATDFGYTEAQYQAAGFINVPPAGITPVHHAQAPRNDKAVALTVSSNRASSTVSFSLPVNPGLIKAEICDSRGRLVRRLHTPSIINSDTALLWDGQSESGLRTPAGSYAIRITGISFQKNAVIVLR
jgi:hypothetical protein